jgi:hypothetical protein
MPARNSKFPRLCQQVPQAQALKLIYRRQSQIANECRVDRFRRSTTPTTLTAVFESDDDAFAGNDEACSF